MKRAQKIGIFASFSFGIFACIIDVVRVYFLFKVETSQDYTWIYTDSMIWAAAQMSIALACACIPAMAPLLKRAQRGRGKQGRLTRRWALLSPTMTSLKTRIRQIWRNDGLEDSESLAEMTVK